MAMIVKMLLLFCFASALSNKLLAQATACTVKPPFYHLHFGHGNVQDVNRTSLLLYDRVSFACPGDGHYAYTSSIMDCFNGDWHNLTEDHTPGDVGGNMLLVNAAYNSGAFFSASIRGFKSQTDYQFGVWLMNVCKPTNKCPFPLLPNLLIRLQTPTGKLVAQFVTGELPRVAVPKWTQHRAQFTAPAGETELLLTMIDSAPGGCGNDFVVDDLTFSECTMPAPVKIVAAKKTSLPLVKKQPVTVKQTAKNAKPIRAPIHQTNSSVPVARNESLPALPASPVPVAQPVNFRPAPLILQQRSNPLVKHIETEEGTIQIDLYDNGEIDGDTVSIYHNNNLVVAAQRLSQRAISIQIQVSKDQPHHELIMVANNLGSIPPNTSLMIVTAQEKRYQVFISSTEQQNAKVVIDLKK